MPFERVSTRHNGGRGRCDGRTRGNGMQWAVFGLVLFGLILTYVISQETRSHNHWRGLVAAGNVDAIAALLGQEIQRWKIMRMPRGTATTLWHGVQTTDLLAAGPDAAHVTCLAEGEFRFVGGRPEEVTSAIDAAMAVAAAVIERILYDVPNLKLDVVRADVYSTFRDRTGAPEQRCILTVTADRHSADEMEWEALRPVEIVGRFDARYRLDDRGLALPIDPGPPLQGTEYVSGKFDTASPVNAEMGATDID